MSSSSAEPCVTVQSSKKLSGSIVGPALETTDKQEKRKTFHSFRRGAVDPPDPPDEPAEANVLCSSRTGTGRRRHVLLVGGETLCGRLLCLELRDLRCDFTTAVKSS